VGEHPLVGGATETTRALPESDGAVERGDHVHQEPGAPVDPAPSRFGVGVDQLDVVGALGEQSTHRGTVPPRSNRCAT
jgi:hypothetical protein